MKTNSTRFFYVQISSEDKNVPSNSYIAQDYNETLNYIPTIDDNGKRIRYFGTFVYFRVVPKLILPNSGYFLKMSTPIRAKSRNHLVFIDQVSISPSIYEHICSNILGPKKFKPKM